MYKNCERRKFVNIHFFLQNDSTLKNYGRGRERYDEWILLLDSRRIIHNTFKVDFELSFWSARRICVWAKTQYYCAFSSSPLAKALVQRWCVYAKEIESGRKEIIRVNHGIHCNSCTYIHYHYIFIIFYTYSAVSSWVFGMREKGFVVNLLHAIDYFENWNNTCMYIQVYV